MTYHGLALIDKQLNFYFGFDVTLGTEATTWWMAWFLPSRNCHSSHRDTSCSGVVWRSALLYQGLGVREAMEGFQVRHVAWIKPWRQILQSLNAHSILASHLYSSLCLMIWVSFTNRTCICGVWKRTNLKQAHIQVYLI